MTKRPGPSDIHPGIAMTGVPHEHLFTVWPHVSAFLEPALDSGETLEEMLTKLCRQEAQLWVTCEHDIPIAAVVTEICETDKGKVCNIWAVGGTGINRWVDFIEMIEAWAQSNGCSRMVIAKARRGVQRLMKGYKVTHVTLGKEL